jgi:DNA-binding SARP family transcriptional activator/TolB-like protein
MASGRDEGARLELFGGFKLNVAGRPVSVSSRRARAMIAYLCLSRDAAATRERLAGLLWSDRGEEQARASLRQCLLEIRAALSPVEIDLIDAGRETVRLRSGSPPSDLVELEDAMTSRDAGALTGLLDRLGSSQLLADCGVGGLFDTWLDEARSQLDRRIGAAVHACLGDLEAAQSWSAVRQLAEAYLQRDPLDERVVAAAMRADAALGHNSTAYRRFQILQAALRKEYGLKPGSELMDALASISASPGRGPGVAAPEAPAPTPRAASGLAGPPLVIVAAFDASEERLVNLAKAIRDEAVSGLARFRDLRVITDPQRIDLIGVEGMAEREGVYVLGSTFRPSLDGVKVAVQLLRIADRHVVWSDALTLPQPEIVETTERIIAQVIGAVLPSINADMVERAQMPPNAIYERYLMARDAAARAESFEQARAAAKELESLIAAEPSFVLPYLPLAGLYNTDFGYTRALSSGEAERERAFLLAKTALAQDRGHVHGYTVMGWCYLWRRQWDAARFHFDQAMALNPFHADRVMETAMGYLFLGETETARRLLDRCLMLNPTPKDEFFRAQAFVELVSPDHGRAASYLELIAKPTLWDTIYSAINASLGAMPLETKAGAARKRLRSIWPEGQPMSEHAVMAWVDNHNPLRSEGDRQRFLQGAREVLVEAGPSGRPGQPGSR